MAKYLVVTHQTALSPVLQQTVRALAAKDPAAEFAVLVPEAPQGATTWEGETLGGAKQRGEAAKTLFEDTAQARVFRTAVGPPDPSGDRRGAAAARVRDPICTHRHLPLAETGLVPVKRSSADVIHVVAERPWRALAGGARPPRSLFPCAA
jgi:hypothetical protein